MNPIPHPDHAPDASGNGPAQRNPRLPGRWALAMAGLGVGALTGCTAPSPDCRRAEETLRRQETLAAMASSGGIDPVALKQARLQKRQACGG